MNKLSFEEAYNELQNVVKQMEGGATTLHKTLDLYERGIKLSQYCTKVLENAELRVRLLREEENGEIVQSAMEK